MACDSTSMPASASARTCARVMYPGLSTRFTVTKNTPVIPYARRSGRTTLYASAYPSSNVSITGLAGSGAVGLHEHPEREARIVEPLLAFEQRAEAQLVRAGHGRRLDVELEPLHLARTDVRGRLRGRSVRLCPARRW